VLCNGFFIFCEVLRSINRIKDKNEKLSKLDGWHVKKSRKIQAFEIDPKIVTG
jgi:hypothetical protein